MDKFNEFLASSHLQIGFKKNLGCASGLFPMQNTVDYLYIATVYASKTFDRVDHKVLFQKLVNRGAPRCFVWVLRSRYGKLVSSVRWNGVLVQNFGVNCGVRQGGILSLFHSCSTYMLMS